MFAVSLRNSPEHGTVAAIDLLPKVGEGDMCSPTLSQHGTIIVCYTIRALAWLEQVIANDLSHDLHGGGTFGSSHAHSVIKVRQNNNTFKGINISEEIIRPAVR